MQHRYTAELVFWISCGLLFYTFFGYGLLISALARWRPQTRVSPRDDAPAAAVCIVLVACNEEKHIGERLRNLLASRYPPQKLRILLVSDGSTDDTVAQARTLRDARIEIVEQPRRAGKAAGLNLAISRCTGDVIIFTDARQQFAEDAIERLVAHFSNPAIGAASGALEIAPAATTTGAGVDAYWRYEKSLRAAESRFDSCIGCTGAIYALRAGLFAPIPEDTLLDDVVIPMQAALQGARVIYDPLARAFDPQPLEPALERRRKARTLAGNFQMLFRHPQWLLPWRNRLWLQLISHKYLRLAEPLFLICALVSNAILAGTAGYAICLGGQLALYLLASLGLVLSSRAPRWLRIPAGFIFLSLMVLGGFWQYLTCDRRGGWK